MADEEPKSARVQRLRNDIAALIDKRGTTRSEDYVAVNAQIAAAQNELRRELGR